MTMPLDDEDEWTELVGADFPRVDLVGRPANGAKGFLVMKQDASAGLLDASTVRDLISKTASEEAPVPAVTEAGEATLPNGIVIKGSPAAMAAFIHAASARKPDQVAKAKYNAADLKRMAANGEAMKDESYPIADEDDLSKAIRAVGRGGADHDAIRRHVIKRAKALGKSSMIPDNWAADGSLKEKVSKDMGPDLDGDPDAMDALDVTMPLAEPAEMGPGDPMDPGSPAWESVDAASAGKWLSVAARLKNALCVLAEREMLEAASADPDDIENAWDLEDAKCAVEYAIEQLAVFAAGEQAEAELGAEMEMIGKALAGSVAPLGVIEGLTAVRKAGRVLSSANEAAIRGAVDSLQKVLASLPEAPVAKSKEAAMTAAQTPAADVAKETASPDEQARNTGPVSAGGTTGMGEPRMTGPDGSLPADGPQKPMPGDMPGRTVVKSALALVYDRDGRLVGVTDAAAVVQHVTKADDGEKKAMQAVFDQDGDLIGIVDPDAIQPVTGAGGKPADDSAGDGEMQDASAADDMTPQPPADAGTPADDVAKAGTENPIILTRDVAKSIAEQAAKTALEAAEAAHQEVVAKMAADKAELADELRVVKARLETVENSPAAPKVFTNGQVPPAHMLRGQDHGTPPVDVAKAAELKGTLYRGTATEQNVAFHEMQQMAVDQLAALHRR